MRIRTVVKGVIACVAFGMASVALANGVTTYAGDNNYYSPAPIPIATLAPSYPSDQGFVLGVQGGYADTHWDNLNVNGLTFSGTGFAARVYGGYDINRFFGMELGWTYLPTASDNFGDDITNYAVDLLAKLSLPVSNGFSIHAKAGGSYLVSNADSSIAALVGTTSVGGSHFGPAFGVGAAYEVIPNLAIGLDWMRYSGNGQVFSGSYQPSPDAVFLGLSYKFPVRL